MATYCLCALAALGAGFGIAHFLSSRAFALLGKSIDPASGLRWLLAVGLIVGLSLGFWRLLVGLTFIALAYCIVNIVFAVKIHALRLPLSPSRYLIGATISRALGMAIFITLWAVRFWPLMWDSKYRFHL
jgi:hypothetical protein